MKDREVKIGQIWRHTRSGNRYIIVGFPFNAISDCVDVLYEPLYQSPFNNFTRQLTGHSKAWLSKNAEGQPRFQLEKDVP